MVKKTMVRSWNDPQVSDFQNQACSGKTTPVPCVWSCNIKPCVKLKPLLIINTFVLQIS